MQQTTTPVAERRAWKELVADHQKIRDLHLRKLFADDLTRGKRMTVDAVGLFLTNNLIHQYRKFKEAL